MDPLAHALATAGVLFATLGVLAACLGRMPVVPVLVALMLGCGIGAALVEKREGAARSGQSPGERHDTLPLPNRR